MGILQMCFLAQDGGRVREGRDYGSGTNLLFRKIHSINFNLSLRIVLVSCAQISHCNTYFLFFPCNRIRIGPSSLISGTVACSCSLLFPCLPLVSPSFAATRGQWVVQQLPSVFANHHHFFNLPEELMLTFSGPQSFTFIYEQTSQSPDPVILLLSGLQGFYIILPPPMRKLSTNPFYFCQSCLTSST